jgi:transcriptional regulator with XRE-family HTH domain
MSELNINKRFGIKVKEYRLKHKISQYVLGDILSYTQAEISKIENGKKDITISKFAYINSILQLIDFAL